MSKCIIYADEKSSVYFLEDGRIYFKSNDSRLQVEAHDVLKSLSGVKTKGIERRKQMINTLLKMNYKDAARLHLKNQMAKDAVGKSRKGKLNKGEYNDK